MGKVNKEADIKNTKFEHLIIRNYCVIDKIECFAFDKLSIISHVLLEKTTTAYSKIY